MEAPSADDFPFLSSAAEFIDWSPGTDTDRLTIELLIGGLDGLAEQPNRG